MTAVLVDGQGLLLKSQKSDFSSELQWSLKIDICRPFKMLEWFFYFAFMDFILQVFVNKMLMMKNEIY